MANYSTSANNNDSNAWKAFDNKADTNWTASYTTTGELVFNFGVPTTIKGVRFTPVSNKLTSFPKKAYLSGSSGSGSPTELQTFNLTEPTDDTPQSFKFDNTPVKYATYIFTFGDTFATSTGTKEVAIAEIEFLVSKGIVIPEPKLQEKTVTPTTTAQTVTADSEYDGLSKVTVEAISLQEKTVTPAGSAQVVKPDGGYDGLSQVTVEKATLQSKTVEPSASDRTITADSEYYGLAAVYLNGATLQTKTVTPTTSQQVITPDSSYYGLSKVTVNAAAPSGTDTSDATASASDILSGKTAYGSSGKITGTMSSNTLATPTISVSSTGKITASVSQSAGYTAGGTKSATQQLDTLAATTVTPATNDYTFSAGRYLTGVFTVKGEPNLVASNIKSGVSIFGVSGSYTGSSSSSSVVIPTIALTIEFNTASLNARVIYPTITTAKVYSFENFASGAQTSSTTVESTVGLVSIITYKATGSIKVSPVYNLANGITVYFFGTTNSSEATALTSAQQVSGSLSSPVVLGFKKTASISGTVPITLRIS